MAAIDFPNSPTLGQLFTVGDITWEWTGSVWQGLGTAGDTGPAGPAGPAGPGVVASATAPEDISVVWYNTENGNAYLYYDGFWASMSGVPTLPTGGTTGQILAKSSSTDYATQWVAGSGMTLITNFSASGVTSVDINGCFSADYDYYRILLRGVTSSGGRVEARMRNAGTTDTSANYDSQIASFDGTSTVAARNSGGTTGWMSGFSTSEASSVVDVFSPFVARQTNFQGISFSTYNNALFGNYSFRHRTSSSYDSLTLLPPSGTMTLTGSIYGYAK